MVGGITAGVGILEVKSRSLKMSVIRDACCQGEIWTDVHKMTLLPKMYKMRIKIPNSICTQGKFIRFCHFAHWLRSENFDLYNASRVSTLQVLCRLFPFINMVFRDNRLKVMHPPFPRSPPWSCPCTCTAAWTAASAEAPAGTRWTWMPTAPRCYSTVLCSRSVTHILCFFFLII